MHIAGVNDVDIQQRIRKIKGEVSQDVSLYISIPFCPSRCLYCSFVSHSVEKTHKLVEPYLELLLQEISATFDLVERLGLRLRTAYIGGGTPTILTAGQMDRLLEHLFLSLIHISGQGRARPGRRGNLRRAAVGDKIN